MVEFFDEGVSRRVAWPDRPQAARLLAAVADPTLPRVADEPDVLPASPAVPLTWPFSTTPPSAYDHGMFVVTLTYLADLVRIDEALQDHVTWLD
ncbi:hypothetical protein ABZV78_04685 [Micromonospora sp. NPDC004540]|uniref:hypothetical protein n=1 Tax=Micromonospora sp. NPDC004540 TaxID=3154457 RepID=UPI0033A22994